MHKLQSSDGFVFRRGEGRGENKRRHNNLLQVFLGFIAWKQAVKYFALHTLLYLHNSYIVLSL